MRFLYLIVFVTLALPIARLHAEEPLDDHSVILSGPDCRKVFDQMSRHSPDAREGFWTPAPEQIKALWQALPAFVAGQTEHILQPLETYHRQYVGFLRGGHRFIYLNAFRMRQPFDKYWRERAVIVGDGGSNYFGVEYDVEASKLLNLDSNGAW